VLARWALCCGCGAVLQFAVLLSIEQMLFLLAAYWQQQHVGRQVTRDCLVTAFLPQACSIAFVSVCVCTPLALALAAACAPVNQLLSVFCIHNCLYGLLLLHAGSSSYLAVTNPVADPIMGSYNTSFKLC
jgi:hypothetical protein